MRLIVTQGNAHSHDKNKPKVFDLKVEPRREKLVLGRETGNDIRLPQFSVSRRHLELKVVDNGLIVRDLGSRNGTFIDGKPLLPLTPQFVQPGSRLRVGEVTLTLEDALETRPSVEDLFDAVTARIVKDQPVEPKEEALPCNRLRPEVKVDLPLLKTVAPMELTVQQATALSALPALDLAPAVPGGSENEVQDGVQPGSGEATSRLSEEDAPAPETAIEARQVVKVSNSPTRLPTINRVAEIPLKVKEKQVKEKAPKKRKREVAKPAVDVTQFFPNFNQMQSRVPQPIWQVLRFFSVIIALAVATLMFVVPGLGLLIFWGFFIPLLPLVFFVAPGLWRNVCPMAALNQMPRVLKLSRALELPNWLKEYSYVIGIGLFLSIVPTRKVLFNTDGPALGILMFASLGMALMMGITFKGKSGWCSSICPLLPVQRIYGQTPFMVVRNSHCQPCVGCTKNCYDFNPQLAYVADMHDSDPRYTEYRKFFAGAFPGLILAFYQVPNPPKIGIVEMYLQVALYIAVSIGTFFALSAFLKVTTNQITALYAAIAFNLYYWFNVPMFFEKIEWLSNFEIPEEIVWGVWAVLLVITIVWIIRTYTKEPLFVNGILSKRAARQATQKAKPNHTRIESSTVGEVVKPEVYFTNQDKRVEVKQDATLLEVIESCDLPIESGCRMGMCGADPVAVLEGGEYLSPLSEDEQTTLERLGLDENTRLACCARVCGPVSISLRPERPKLSDSANGLASTPFEYDAGVEKVVIIGNGIAGVTAADHVRRRHPDCQIDLIGREPHHLYNRMGISRLIYGRSAMRGLYLLPEDWYDEYKVNFWLNTQATGIDRQAKQVKLGTGEILSYDRLILAMGSSSTLPPFEGSNLEGVFILREADDAMRIRYFAQAHGCRRAVVAGGGLLGLEAAYALQKLGLEVTVLERSDSLLRRQLDKRAGQFLREYLESQEMQILVRAEVEAAYGHDRIQYIRLKDGRQLQTDIILVAAGIQPNIELAAEAGLEISRGVLVDDYLRTSDPAIFAVGDLAEHHGQIYGLWPAAVEMGETAAINSIGGSSTYNGTVAATALKVVGIDLMSIGRFETESTEDLVITTEVPKEHHYRKLIISEGKIAGAILLGFPELAPAITGAVKKQRDVTPLLKALKAGDWQCLGK
ncbi:MAG TPA: FAD-dependent oxidoreductase [Chloroflexia bacterium]|nr:FAD-dependent oxidoreductase [Chloroflexia bacterium]